MQFFYLSLGNFNPQKMKKILFLTITLCLLSFISVHAQKVRLALQGGYGFEIEKAAVGGSLEVFLVDNFSLAVGANFYVPAEKFDFGGTDVKISYWELNADLHVYAINTEALGLYGIVGLNVMNVKAKFGSESDSDNETGANLGIGLSVGSGLPFVEVKYETVSTGQFFIGGGFRFPIN